MKVKLIAAVARDRAIGYQGQLLFHLPEDMARFRQLTWGHAVIMGRKTYESLPHGPLPHRRNIVLSRRGGLSSLSPLPEDTSLEVCPSLEEALRRCASLREVFVIGGGLSAGSPFGARVMAHGGGCPCPAGGRFFPRLRWLASGQPGSLPSVRFPPLCVFLCYLSARGVGCLARVYINNVSILVGIRVSSSDSVAAM